MNESVKVLGQWAGHSGEQSDPYITPYTKTNSKQLKCYI